MPGTRPSRFPADAARFLATAARRLAATVLAASIALPPVPAHAWGDDGHRIVALIAWRHLTPSARAKVEQILRDDSDTLTAPDLASRATWADAYRDSDRNGDRKRYLLTREWHFVDIELDRPDLVAACFGRPPPAAPASEGPAKSCVVDRIEAFAAELRDLPPSSPERTVAFKFVLHLVGDLHQPLHAADRQDRGGNETLVLANNRATSQPLHGYWDTTAVERIGTDPVAVAAMLDQRHASRCRGWMQGMPADWAWDSFAVAKDVAYQLGAPVRDDRDRPAYRLSKQYKLRASEVAGEQLAKAGCRLAMMLNRALP